MSEFSDSLHLVDLDEAAAVSHLSASGTMGLVLPRRGRHVTILVPRSQQAAFLASYPGLAVSYEYAADNGITVRLYEGARELARLSCSFGEQGLESFSRETWLARGLLHKRAATSIEWGLSRTVPDRERHWVAEHLELHDVDGVCGDDVVRRLGELMERFPQAQLARASAVPVQAVREVVLCALSEARRELLEDEPDLAEELLEARQTQEIRGMLSLGRCGPSLVQQLAAELPEIAEAVLGTAGIAVSDEARCIEQVEVARLALVLLAFDAEPAEHADVFRALVKHYVEAAERGEAMLVMLA